MSLEDLGNIGEFVGAIAVVVSLIYLALQIRQNTRQITENTIAIGNASYHQALEQGWVNNIEIARDPEIARIMAAGHRDTESLNENERVRFFALLENAAFALENTMRLREHGLVDADVWENLLDNSERYYQQPGFQRFVRSRQGVLSKRLRDLLQERYGMFSDEDTDHEDAEGDRS